MGRTQIMMELSLPKIKVDY